MSYTPTTWQSGDVITSTKLNKLEQGVADSATVLITTMSQSGSTYVLDKTFEEIYTALRNSIPVFVKWHRNNGDDIGEDYYFPVINTYSYFNMKRVVVQWLSTLINNGTMYVSPAISQFSASTVSSYPEFTKRDIVPPSVMIYSSSPDPFA